MIPRSILVLEDEELLQEIIKSKLEQDGFRVIGARMVDQALDYLANLQQVDAIWLDHYMPEKTGLDFLAAIKQHPVWSRVPVFLVTNTITPDIINQYIKAGIRQYYIKMLTKLETIITRIELELQQGR